VEILRDYLLSTEVVDWRHPGVEAQARRLASTDPLETARRCFEFVRDGIHHSWDYQQDPVTCNASEVLHEATGYCYAKSHLLAALLRANGLPAGFCYQRLAEGDSASGFCLHGLNAVHLPSFGWYRIDARGNKTGVDAQFSPPLERLAFAPRAEGEFLLPGIYANPLPNVIQALHSHATWQDLAANLPDLHPDALTELQAHLKDAPLR
jgi:transglutaminase-like putative cysteine protease